MYVCTPQLAGANPLVGPNSFKTLGEGPRLVPPEKGVPPYSLYRPRRDGRLSTPWPGECRLTALVLLTRGETPTGDQWICSLMLYHLSYLTTTYIHIYITSLSELLCLIPILVGSSVATVCPPERDTALRTAVTTVTRVPL